MDQRVDFSYIGVIAPLDGGNAIPPVFFGDTIADVQSQAAACPVRGLLFVYGLDGQVVATF